MDKERVVYISNVILFSNNEKLNYIIFLDMDGTGGHHVE
jgi:hypothetical protein